MIRASLLAALLAAPHAAHAEWTFKRVAAPQMGRVAPLIDIRIAPRPLIGPGSEAPQGGVGDVAAHPNRTPPPPVSGTDPVGWFWAAVPPGRDQTRGRFRRASDAAARPPDGVRLHTPRMETLVGIARAHGAALLRHTAGTRVSPALALAVIAVESAGRVEARSHANAQGLMQLIPATAERFGVTDAYDPAQNIRGGVTYLDWLIERFDGDAVLALAGYNAGEGAVDKHRGIPPYKETRAYVPKVMAAWNVARLLCSVPPDLPGDPCVFGASGRAPGRVAALPMGPVGQP